MAKILVHAVAATAGGGATYFQNLVTHLSSQPSHHHWVLAPPPGFDPTPLADHASITCLTDAPTRRKFGRLWFDQYTLRQYVRQQGIELLLATGNFGMFKPPIPQILLNRNALYFSEEHLRQLRQRRCHGELMNILLRRRLALASIRASRLNIVPTQAFADDIRQYAPELSASRFRVVPHGFDHERFAGKTPVANAPGAPKKRILLVSHYNYFRNFETVLRAIGKLRRTEVEPFELVLTTKLGHGVHDHRYDTTAAARLIDELDIRDRVVMLGTQPHHELPALYRSADVVVCPSYAESFGHPMVEAMAMGRPIVASDLPTQREMCRDSALYFPVFDASACADRIRSLLLNPPLGQRLGVNGVRRAADFSWRRHFADLTAGIDEGIAAASARQAA